MMGDLLDIKSGQNCMALMFYVAVSGVIVLFYDFTFYK